MPSKKHTDIRQPAPSFKLSRREILARGMLLASAGIAMPLLTACGSSSSSSSSPTGNNGGYRGTLPPLRDTPDENGLYLPEGFSSRVIAEAGLPVGLTGYFTPLIFFPDGGQCFPDPEVLGGWIHVVNREVPVIGGTTAFRFAADGSITDAYSILDGTSTNCAGGATPWGTWISCEEVDDGTSWETHPLGQGLINGVEYPRQLDSLGIFKHEAAAVNADKKHVYLTEDQSDGCFYRFIGTDPYNWNTTPGDLTQGYLQVAVVRVDGELIADTNELAAMTGAKLDVSWINVPNPTGGSSDPTRSQVDDATHFHGGEGCWFHKGHVYFTTKGDNRVWDYNTTNDELTIFYDDDNYSSPVLTGVDNIIVDSQSDCILVAEDGGNLEAVVITPDFQIAPIVRFQTAGNSGSEVTGLAFNPARNRLYLNSQRGSTLLPLDIEQLPGNGGGVVFEIRRDDGLPIFSS